MPFEICPFSYKVDMPLGEKMFCRKMKGIKLPPIPILKSFSYQDGEFCIATSFDLNLEGHVVGESKVDISKMYECPYREIFVREEKLKVHTLIDYSNEYGFEI
jgi:hypothetical protein